MKINEVEERLGISKANIRFYEKQGLVSPARSVNGYRDYSEEDVSRLQSVIVLRKLGIPVQDIEKIQSGELQLQQAIEANIAQLEAQIEQLNGSLQLSRQIAREQTPQLDTPRYWALIQEKESRGEQFAEIFGDYWDTVIMPELLSRLLLKEGAGVWKIALSALALCGIYGAVKAIFFDESFWVNFFHWPIVLAVVVLITFPIHLLGRKRPKAASLIGTILGLLSAAFLIFVVLYLIIGFGLDALRS